MPWEEPGESWQVPAESEPPPRLPGEAARGKPRAAGPSGLRRSLRTPRSFRPPAAGELRPGERRGGGGGGAEALSPRSPSPAQGRLLAEAAAAAAASVALANSRGARFGLGPPRRLEARRRLSAAGGAT